jgi:hypothetical protein
MENMELKTGEKGTVTITVNKILALIIAIIAVVSPIVSVTALATAYGSDVDAHTEQISYLNEHHDLVDMKISELETNDAVQNSEIEQLDRLEGKIDKLDDKFDNYIQTRGGS